MKGLIGSLPILLMLVTITHHSPLLAASLPQSNERIVVAVNMITPPIDIPPPVSSDNANSARSVRTSAAPIASSDVTVLPSTDLTPVVSTPESLNTDYRPTVVLRNSVEYSGWKTAERYEILINEGLQNAYYAGEQIIFFVSGKSYSLAVDKLKGFNVIATFFDVSRNVGKRAVVEYDTGKNAWMIKLIAPADITKEYKLVVNLFCEKDNSPCSDMFGFGTQIDKIIPIQIR